MTKSENGELSALTRFAFGLAEASGKAILPHFRSGMAVDNKRPADFDPVTEGDRAAERVMREMIEKAFPAHGIIGEEFGEKKGSSAYTWILDPIDGTRGFVVGMPTWGTLIGLYRDGKPYFGMMHQPIVGETFYGSANGAFVRNRLGETPLKSAAAKPLAQARIGTTAPELIKGGGFERLRARVQLARFSGDCYFFALVAAGTLDLALDAGTQIYDVAALIPIIRGAGGHVENWDGTDVARGGNILAAGSKEMWDAAQAALNG